MHEENYCPRDDEAERGPIRWLPAPRQVPDRIFFNVSEYNVTGKHGKDRVALWKASPCEVQVDDVASLRNGVALVWGCG